MKENQLKMFKKSKISSKIQVSEDESFRDYVVQHKIEPLDNEKIYLSKTPPKKRPLKKSIPIIEPLSFVENQFLEPVTAEEVISFARQDLSFKIVRHLRSGKIPIEATLDLHGMTVTKAEKQLRQFLNACSQKNLRCVLIIHGKGKLSDKPVLKNKLNNWLRHVNQILAFCSARPSHGGQGAIYVLLKKSL